MALSILHRITGIGLAVGTLLLIYWLWAAASGAEAYFRAQTLIGGWFGRLLLLGWTLALFYHLFNDIRHLFWDAGKGFDLRTARLSGAAVVLAALVATAVAWAAGFMAR